MSECLVCDKETGGSYKMYCDDHKPKKKITTKSKVVKWGFSSRKHRNCSECGKEISGYRVVKYCHDCYLKIAKKLIHV